MAEEPETISSDKVEPTEETADKKEQKYRQETFHNQKCNFRIEELAKPRKILVRATYVQYKHVLPKPNAILVKQYLDEEYAKNTNDIVDYFEKTRNAHDKKKNKKLSKIKAKRLEKENSERRRRKEMITKLKEIMKKALFHAYMNPMQIIMTSMIRRVSDKILLELCELRHMRVPDREDTNVKADLLCSLSDWLAYCVDYVYYEVQVRKVHDYEELMKQVQNENNPKEEAQ